MLIVIKMDKKADTHNKIKTLQEEAKIYRTRNSSNATSPIATKKKRAIVSNFKRHWKTWLYRVVKSLLWPLKTLWPHSSILKWHLFDGQERKWFSVDLYSWTVLIFFNENYKIISNVVCLSVVYTFVAGAMKRNTMALHITRIHSIILNSKI